MRIAVFGASGKTGRAVTAALARRGVDVVPIGRAHWNVTDGDPDPALAEALIGCAASYLIAPNLFPDEPDYVRRALTALAEAQVPRVVYHSVASPAVPAMPHHLGKAIAEDLVRRSGLSWTILQPGPYLQNLDLSGPVAVPYRITAPFGLADLAEVGEAAAIVLTEAGHEGATYELASRVATVQELAADAGVTAHQVPYSPVPTLSERENSWLRAMFDYYDRFGLPVGTLPLRALLNSIGVQRPGVTGRHKGHEEDHADPLRRTHRRRRHPDRLRQHHQRAGHERARHPRQPGEHIDQPDQQHYRNPQRGDPGDDLRQ